MVYSTYLVNLSRFFIIRDRSNYLISLESSDHGLQKYLFSFSKFCFIVQKINFFAHDVAESGRTMKNGVSFAQ
jgi:hypothetical protein